MTLWLLFPILFALATVVFNYFALYLRALDKIADLERDLKEEIQKLSIQLMKVETKHDTLCDEHSKQLALIPIIDVRQAKLEAQLSVYFKTLDPFLAAAIHSPIHVERDKLMEKLEHDELTYEQAKELAVKLEQTIKTEKNGNKKWIEIVALGRVRSMIVGFEFDNRLGAKT